MAAFGPIFLISKQQVFVITPYCDVPDGEASHTNVIIFVVVMYTFVFINHEVCRP